MIDLCNSNNNNNNKKSVRAAAYEMKYNKRPPKEALVTTWACTSLFDEGQYAYHSWHGVWEEDLWSKNGVITLRECSTHEVDW